MNYRSAYNNRVDFAELLGKTILNIEKQDDEVLIFNTDGGRYHMTHLQDCCESVFLEEVIGDLDDLIGNPLLQADEEINHGGESDNEYESQTWTFYKMATIKGSVTLRWLGTSNGYYSEEVDLFKEEI